ncbi:cytochrome ubiquinol oxidase subunit I [Streptomyces sp. NBC_00847]|uniref:cytochrome ubiquinol oxidase subunit I n=1 Tax=unclassified Streptomyces TaxID=2593676 RepID=UPI00225DF574|nr:cytochrome ubiquinol oxidase subunit I [Streptomyces sp. NBC_00847]MCX4885692.1 cytochrome ubiquinol oxidase subunit I [Streptomyces sp. NBC_00847]
MFSLECGWITTEVGRQPWIVYQNMRVSEAVTDTRAASLWAMFGVVVLVYVLVLGAFLGVLVKMSRRWRLADEGALAGAEAEDLEGDTPYGPRPLATTGGRERDPGSDRGDE